MGGGRILLTGATLLAILASGNLGRAQVPTLDEQKVRLSQANAASQAAQARARSLEQAAANERDQAAQARAQEAAAAARIEAAAADIAAAQARIAIIDRALAAQRVRLAEREGTITRLVAALQSMARRPPVLGLVQPGSTADIVHVRAVLGTTMPVVEARTADVRAELARVRELRTGAQAAVQMLRDGRARIERERLALLHMEAAHRLRSEQLDRSALVESDRAIALGEQARDLVDAMEATRTDTGTVAALAALPGPLPRPLSPGQSSPEARPTHGAPYLLPVAGSIVTGFGELSDVGVRSRGLTLAAAPDATVVAPAAGRVVFAGRFRDYGMVVILDHGQGWTTLISGLAAINVRAGSGVGQRGAIGRAGRDAPQVTVELRRRGLPMDLTALLG